MLSEKMNEPLQENVTSRKRIGAILIHSGKIKEQDADRIVDFQKKQSMLFGEAAVKLKLVQKEDIEHALSSQFSIPTINVDKLGLAKDLVIARKPVSRQAEAFRNIRTQLLLKAPKENPLCLAIVGAEKQEGKSYIAANLAIAFAQMGKRTILIDSDMRKPQQHILFNTTSAYGLSTILAKSEISDFAITHTGLANLSILPAGPIPQNPLELISNPVYEKVLSNYRTLFDVLIVDTPSATEFSDSEIIAANTGSALLVAAKNKTSIDAAKTYADKLKSHNITLLGSVINSH